MLLGWNRPTNCCCTNSVLVVLGLTARACRQPGCQRHLYWQVQLNMWAQCLKTTKSPPSHLRLSCSSHSDAHHHQIAGFNETVRNWHGEWYFTRSSRGIGIQFSTSNNTTSLNDHWLVYRHCAKLSFQTFLKIDAWSFFSNLHWIQIGFNSRIYSLKLDDKSITIQIVPANWIIEHQLISITVWVTL